MHHYLTENWTTHDESLLSFLQGYFLAFVYIPPSAQSPNRHSHLTGTGIHQKLKITDFVLNVSSIPYLFLIGFACNG